jgi:hypothetical protein
VAESRQAQSLFPDLGMLPLNCLMVTEELEYEVKADVTLIPVTHLNQSEPIALVTTSRNGYPLYISKGCPFIW